MKKKAIAIFFLWRIRLSPKAILLIMALVFGSGIISLAQEGKPDKQEKEKAKRTSTVIREVQGTVGWIKSDRIAVTYASSGDSESEILLPISKDAFIEHKKSISQIAVGDMVRVQYEEVTEEGPEGEKVRRQAKVISFLGPGVKRPTVAQPSESAVMVSGE